MSQSFGPPQYLSVSQVRTLKTCQRQFLFRHILRERETKNKNLITGSAFHKMLEGRDITVEVDELVKGEPQERATYPHLAVLQRMKASYDRATQAAPKTRAREIAFKFAGSGFDISGYADSVRVTEDGWYIGEDKTAATFDENKASMLAFDLQLCAYAVGSKEIASQAGVDTPFRGLIYTATTKPSQKWGKTDTAEKFLKRVDEAGSIQTKVWQIEMTDLSRAKTIIDVEFSWAQRTKDEIIRNWRDSDGNLDVIPSNQHACFNFNTPCPHFEKCYGVPPATKKKPEDE